MFNSKETNNITNQEINIIVKNIFQTFDQDKDQYLNFKEF